MTWDPGGRTLVREVALLMVEQGPILGLWVGKEQSQLWSHIWQWTVVLSPWEWGTETLGPLRAGLTSATAPASGSSPEEVGVPQATPSARVSITEDWEPSVPKAANNRNGEACCGPAALLLPLWWASSERIPPGAQQLLTGRWDDVGRILPLLSYAAILDWWAPLGVFCCCFCVV